MKKNLVLLIALVSLTVLAGCIRTNPARTPIVQGTASGQGITAEQGTSSINKKADFIGEEEAKRIALEKAGVNSDDARFEKIEFDRDDGIWKYEIDFRLGRIEYDVDINAENGDVVVFETDYDD